MSVRTLVVHFDVRYINRTVAMWPLIFRHLGPVDFFGPGFQPHDVLDDGLAAFVKRHGPYDVVVTSEHALRATEEEHRIDLAVRAYRQNYVLHFEPRRALARQARVLRELQDHDGLVLVCCYETDPYSVTTGTMALLRAWEGAHVLGLGVEFVAPLASLDHDSLAAESLGAATDNWHDFVRDCADRVVSMPASLGENEFRWSDLSWRPRQWSVVGTSYGARRRARDTLSAADVPWAGKWLHRSLAVADRLRLRPYTRPSALPLVNGLFMDAIERSRLSFTCGSALAYPLRKFFEIPALGAVLVCRRFSGFEAAGFTPGQNCLVAEPEELPGLTAAYTGAELQRIADAGRAMVWERHTVRARVEQMARVLDRMAAGDFAGSCWDRGVPRLRHAPRAHET